MRLVSQERQMSLAAAAAEVVGRNSVPVTAAAG